MWRAVGRAVHFAVGCVVGILTGFFKIKKKKLNSSGRFVVFGLFVESIQDPLDDVAIASVQSAEFPIEQHGLCIGGFQASQVVQGYVEAGGELYEDGEIWFVASGLIGRNGALLDADFFRECLLAPAFALPEGFDVDVEISHVWCHPPFNAYYNT